MPVRLLELQSAAKVKQELLASDVENLESYLLRSGDFEGAEGELESLHYQIGEMELPTRYS